MLNSPAKQTLGDGLFLGVWEEEILAAVTAV